MKGGSTPNMMEGHSRDSTIDINYAAPQAHRIVNVTLHGSIL
jgi:hypothetical protein